jgi:ANTAR domain
MAPLLSPEPPPNGLRPDYAFGPRQVLTDSAPASRETTARPLVQLPPAPAPRDLAYTTALVAACQRMWASRDVALLWRTIVDEALGLIAADGAAVVAHTERSWQILAAGPNDAGHDDAGQDDAGYDDSAAAAAIEMPSHQGLLRQPISIDDLAEGASGDGLGWRALLVAAIESSPRQPVRLMWYATRPSTLSPYVKVAEAFAHLASLALGTVKERDNLNRAAVARHRVGLAQGLLMTRRQLTADQAFTLLQRQSQNSHVKLRTIAQTVIQTGDLPANGESKTT